MVIHADIWGKLRNTKCSNRSVEQTVKMSVCPMKEKRNYRVLNHNSLPPRQSEEIIQGMLNNHADSKPTFLHINTYKYTYIHTHTPRYEAGTTLPPIHTCVSGGGL